MSILTLPVSYFAVLVQSVRLAFGQIWANKVRAVLTTLGIVIAVAAVVVVVAAVNGLRTSVLSEIEAFGTNNIFVIPDRPDEGPMSDAPRRVIMFPPNLFDDMLDNTPSVKYFTRMTGETFTLRAGEERVSANVGGIDPAWHDIESRGVIEGRPFSLVDIEQARSVCLIDTTIRDELDLDRDPTGQDILIDGRRFRVVGLIEEPRQMSIGGPPQSSVFVPFSTLWRMDPNPWRFIYVIAAAQSPEVSEQASNEIEFYLRAKRKIEAGDPNTFQVNRVEAALEQVGTITAAITMASGGVVGISLLVGGIGIMNIMLVSVSERTREIGLRKAVGARPGIVLTQFLIEAVVLCMVGGLIGWLIGEAMTAGMRALPGGYLADAKVPLWAIVVSFSFSAATGLIFGMFPAVKAARLDPIVALRHE